MKALQIKDILQRVKDIYDIATDAELSEFFGVTPSALSNWKYRNTIDYKLLFQKCDGVNYHFILTGEGDKYEPEIETIDSDLRLNSTKFATSLANSQDPKKILIIEDHNQMRQLIERHLRKEGYTVLGASNGKDGIALAKEYIPDLILSDIVMPGISGYQVLKEVRSDLHTTHIPLLFISSKTDLAEVRHAMNLGADDYLTKPIQIKELLGAVHARLHKSALVQRQMDATLQKIRSGFVRVLPHEFRTPLSTIIGGTKYVIDSFDDLTKAEILELLKLVSNSTNNLNKLLEKILLFAKLESLAEDVESQLQLRKKYTLNVGDVVSDVVLDSAQKHSRMKDIELNIQAHDTSVAITPVYLTTLITEVMENAFKFSQMDSPIHVSTSIQNGMCYINVKDEGRGMSAAQIKHIGAFTQFDREHYEQQGVGLGFTIIHRIIEIFNGALTIESEPGEGTRIKVGLPIVENV